MCGTLTGTLGFLPGRARSWLILRAVLGAVFGPSPSRARTKRISPASRSRSLDGTAGCWSIPPVPLSGPTWACPCPVRLATGLAVTLCRFGNPPSATDPTSAPGSTSCAVICLFCFPVAPRGRGFLSRLCPRRNANIPRLLWRASFWMPPLLQRVYLALISPFDRFPLHVMRKAITGLKPYRAVGEPRLGVIGARPRNDRACELAASAAKKSLGMAPRHITDS